MDESHERSEAGIALDLLASGGLVHAHTLRSKGVRQITLTRLVKAGKVERLSVGVYRLAEAAWSQHEGFAVATARSPHAVVFHLSAAAYHGLTLENPSEVWLMLPFSSGVPKSGSVRVVRTRRGDLLREGVDTVRIEGMDVRITSPARTVVDLFRHAIGRPPIGTLDDAIKALAKYREDGGDVAEVSRLAHALGEGARMGPYLSAAQHMALSW